MTYTCRAVPGYFRWCTLVFSLLLVGEDSNALSCKIRNHTLDEAYRSADSVIVGLVTECAQAESADRWTSGSDKCSFVALEVLKDAVAARDYSGVASSSGCGLSLHVGDRYLLFLDDENVPLTFSEPLEAETWSNRLLEPRIRVMRDYRDGRTGDLSEPWVAQKGPIGNCSLSHYVGGNHIQFSIRPGSATPLDEVRWEEITVEGRPLFSREQAASLRRQVLRSDERPENDVQVLQVSFGQGPQTDPRDVVIAVGSQAWKLERHEVDLSEFLGASGLTRADVTFAYSLRGEAVEEILSAIDTPSDIVVTATLAESSLAHDTDAELPGSQPAPAVDPTVRGDNVGSAITSSRPRSSESQSSKSLSSSAPATKTDGTPKTRSRYRRMPEYVLRFESSSTNLGNDLENYRQCYEDS